MKVLQALQRTLEELYRVDAAPDVSDFILTEEQRGDRCEGGERMPREQLLLREHGGALEIGLYVDELALARLERGLAPDGANLAEFLLAAEGVSHFLYVSVRAREDRPFSGLELELQAEVDKYLLMLVAGWPHARGLRERLFERVSYLEDLSVEEHDRYHTASTAAGGYVAALESRFVSRRALGELLADVRRFYRLDCGGKLDHIVKRAA